MDEILGVGVISENNSTSSDVTTYHLEKRRIILNTLVDDDLLEKVSMMIMKWNEEDKFIEKKYRKKIVIFINSDGGDSVMGLHLLNMIKCSKTPVYTVGCAKCSSMASYILAAGHKRYCFEDTVILYHDGTAGYYSSGNKGKDIQKFYDSLDEKMKNFMMRNTKMTEEFLDSIKDREYYMFPEEAKELGIVDYIIGVDCKLNNIF